MGHCGEHCTQGSCWLTWLIYLMMVMMLPTMLKLQLCLSLVGLCQGEGLAESDPDSQFEYGIFGTPSLGTPSLGTPNLGTGNLGTASLGTASLGKQSLGTHSLGTHSQVHRAIQRECKVEMVTIVRTNCKVEYDEECTTEEKVVGDKVTYEKECEEKEVEECKPVHYIPRSGLGGFANLPTKLESECEKVMKMVEICVKTPKESCEESEQLAPSTTCERVK